MNIRRDAHLRDYVGRRAAAAQAALVCVAFLAFSVALLLLFTRTYLGAAQTSQALLVWTAVFAFVGALSASGLVWAMTVNGVDVDVSCSSAARPGAVSCPVDTTGPHPASLSLLIEALDTHGGHRVLTH